MLERHPPRRDPRLLFIDATKAPVRHVVLDPWEVRGLGELATHAPSQALLRLVLQLRPSHIAIVRPEAPEALRGLANGLAVLARGAVPFVNLTAADLARAVAQMGPDNLREQFPELRHLARSPREAKLLETVRHALAVLLHHPLPHRHYAPRFASLAAPRVARGRPRSSRPTSLP